MPIINGIRFQKKEKIKADINCDIAEKIRDYCIFANIDDIGFFIEEAAGFIFAKDREWKQYVKSAKKRIDHAQV